MPTEENNNIAVLIDAENVDPAYAGHIMSYAYSLGNVCIREIYGSGISLNEWADPILAYSIHTNFTLRPNRYKNSSDICLVIGAMEILAATREGGKAAVAAVVIASSDSDFSALAVHLRSAGIDVIGMGEGGRVNPMWPRACTDFIPLEAKTPLIRKREETPGQTNGNGKSCNTATEQAADKPGNTAANQPSEKTGNNAAAQATDKPENMTAEQTSDKPGSTGNTGTAAAETGKKQKKAETEKEHKKKDAVRVAPTHKARMEIIRGLITEEIGSHGGRIGSNDLFRVIGSNPEYKYDQQRSRRAPMDYLKKQYGMWFDFEPQENGSSMITLKEAVQTEQAEEFTAEPAGDESIEQNAEATGEMNELNEDQAGEQSETINHQVGEQSELSVEAASVTTELIEDQAGEQTESIENQTHEQTEPNAEQVTEQSEPKKEQKGEQTKPKKNKNGKQAEPKKAQSGKQSGQKKDQSDRKAESKKSQSGKQTKTNKGQKAKQNKQAEARPEETLSPVARQLTEAGIPLQDAAHVAEVLAGCKNLRDSYNHLRQTFGNDTGKKYQQMIKDAGIQIG